jgi:hypothetical protein
MNKVVSKEKFADKRVKFGHLGIFFMIFLFVGIAVDLLFFAFQPTAPVVHHPAPTPAYVPSPTQGTGVGDSGIRSSGNITTMSDLLNLTDGSIFSDINSSYSKLFGTMGNFILVIGIIGGVVAVFGGIASVLRHESW